MNGSAANQQQLGGHQALSGPQNGPVVYGSGLVYGGKVYPVLIDGVPIRPPAVAHQAAVQQRMQMQPMQQPQMQMQQRLQGPHLHQTSPEPLPHQGAYQRSDAPADTQNLRTFGRATVAAAPSMTQQRQPLNNHQQLQLRHQPQVSTMGGSYSSFYNNHQPTACGDLFESWNGYTMFQPSDLDKPYTLS